MEQLVFGLFRNGRRTLALPTPRAHVVPGIPWGSFDHLFTPAFWASQVWFAQDQLSPGVHRIGRTLREEVAACLLGGYGIPAEVGVAAYRRIRSEGLLARGASAEGILAALSRPLEVRGRQVCYRFARRKASLLAQSLARLDAEQPPESYVDRQYRDWLTTLPGIGLKTASWITRNRRDSDEIAILDIHVFRACRIVGLFPTGTSVERHYIDLERLFLEFARALRVRASALDAVIWSFMRNAHRLALASVRRLDSDELRRSERVKFSAA